MPIKKRQYKYFGLCSNCDETKAIKTATTKLCYACWAWQKKYGEPRPIRRYTNICLVCGKPGIPKKRAKGLTMGRCATCYRYFVDHGVERPKRLRDKENRKCRNQNCKRPLANIDSVKGRCCACRSFLKRRNVERPKILCFRTDTKMGQPKGYFRFDIEEMNKLEIPSDVLGWCECGEVAKNSVVIRVGHAPREREKDYPEGELILCDECYQYEQEI